MAEADGIAAHPFEPPEPACEPVFESRCTQGPEIVMQAYPFDEDFTTVEFQPLLGRHFHIADAEGRFIKVRPAVAVSDPRTHGIELRSLRIPQLRIVHPRLLTEGETAFPGHRNHTAPHGDRSARRRENLADDRTDH